MVDLSTTIANTQYRLGFKNLAELTTGTPWVSVDELYQFADEAAKRLAYMVALFIGLDTSVQITAGTALYDLPDNHVSTIVCAIETQRGGGAGASGQWGTGIFGGTPFGPSAEADTPPQVMYQLLRISRALDLWALDADWPTTIGDPLRCSYDAGGPGSVTIYPIPINGSEGTLVQVCQQFPPDIVAPTTDNPAGSQIAVPTVLTDYFAYAMLAGAKGKESEHGDEAMAEHYRQRCSMYEAVMAHLWGPAQ